MSNANFPIVSTDYAGRQCMLRPSGNATTHAIGVGRIVTSYRGEKYVVTGGTAPHKASSSGRVYVKPYPAHPDDADLEYFPAVFDLVWVPVPAGAGDEPAKTTAQA